MRINAAFIVRTCGSLNGFSAAIPISDLDEKLSENCHDIPEAAFNVLEGLADVTRWLRIWPRPLRKKNSTRRAATAKKGVAADAYVPADGLTDPAPETTLVHLEADTDCHVKTFE